MHIRYWLESQKERDWTDQINWIEHDRFNRNEARWMPKDWRKEIKVEIRANNKKYEDLRGTLELISITGP
jgi:hypothetical protein